MVDFDEGKARRVADRIEQDTDVATLPGTLGDVEWAELICTCTTSATPLFDGQRVAPGSHVTAIGSYRPTRREWDDTLLLRSALVVEDRDVAFTEAGDLAIPREAGILSPQDVAADLRELVREPTVRRSGRDITVFKSVGMADQDLAIAEHLYRARAQLTV